MYRQVVQMSEKRKIVVPAPPYRPLPNILDDCGLSVLRDPPTGEVVAIWWERIFFRTVLAV